MENLKKIIIAVTNDLVTDQRVDRVSNTLVKMGFDVMLVGRERKKSLPLKLRAYRIKRMRLWFSKGPLFYAEYNFRLFLFILFNRFDLVLTNDLDTLCGGYYGSRIRRIPLFHDCHEYFRGVPELKGRKITTWIWKRIEDHIFPKLKTIYAVNGSVAGLYNKEYGNEISVIRNVPVRRDGIAAKNRDELGIPADHRILLYQGALNIDRGIEEAMLALKYLKTSASFLVIGTGDIDKKLKELAEKEHLNGRVIFTGPIPLEELYAYTLMADIGLSIEKDVSLNYHYCLPNKFLDYIQANVPVLISPLPEMKAIMEKYNIGETIINHDPEHLALKIDRMLTHTDQLAVYRENLKKASSDLCWENEEKELIRLFRPYA
jgi:glycosyltransferase involved in cell wall biosynthesis